MSSLQVIMPAAALGRHFDLAELVSPVEVVSQQDPASLPGKKVPEKLAAVTPASRLAVRPAPEMVSSGIAEIDSLIGGLPRGCLSEICGPASSGRTSFLLAALAAATQRDEVCALVDVSDALNPQSAAVAGMNLKKMLWVRCPGAPCSTTREERHRAGRKLSAISSQLSAKHCAAGESAGSSSIWDCEKHKDRGEFAALENALRVTDLLLQSSGFGMVVIDLGDISFRAARRVPLTSWFRFRRAVENTNTVLLVITRQSCAQTCASLVLEMQGSGFRLAASGDRLPLSGAGVLRSAQDFGTRLRRRVNASTHAQILEGLSIRAELLRSRMERKPVRSAQVEFEIKTAWGGG